MLVILGRRRAVTSGIALLGIATALFGRSLAGDDKVELLLTEPAGVALLAVGAAFVALLAVAFARYPAVVPSPCSRRRRFGCRSSWETRRRSSWSRCMWCWRALSSHSPSVSCVVRARRLRHGSSRFPSRPSPRTPRCPTSGRTTSAREGSCSRSSSFRSWPGSESSPVRRSRPGCLRALACTLVALGVLFAGIGIWQAHTRHALLRAQPRGRERVHDRSSESRRSSRTRACMGATSSFRLAVLNRGPLASPRSPHEWLAVAPRGRVSVRRALLLVFPVELRGAVRGRRRDRVSRGGASTQDRARRERVDGDARRGGVRRPRRSKVSRRRT